MTYFVAPGTKGRMILQPKMLSLSKQREQAKHTVETVCKYYGFEYEDLFKKGRKQDVVIARQIAIYLIRMYVGMTQSELGRYFGKDHTTILFSYNKVQEQLTNKFDDTYKHDVEKIKSLL